MLILRQAVGDLVVVALLGHEYVHFQMGGSGRVEGTHRDADPVARRRIEEDIEDPQVEQNPRRTLAKEWYQVRFSCPAIVTAFLGASLGEAK